MNFLLASAKRTPPTGHKASSKPELPDPMYICEWVYKNILKFPEELRKKWRQCCVNEISTLKAHDVFELADLRKHACLVAKGFSQIKGINFNELFSPVV